MNTLTEYEREFAAEYIIAGVDEAGRGPLAGPVTAAAVIFPADIVIKDIDDSKKLKAVVREHLAKEIKLKAISWAVGQASVEEIDRLNILGATRLAMTRAIEKLNIRPGLCLVDGYSHPGWHIRHIGVVKGDQRCFTIAAASILAKVYRDNYMLELHYRFPYYGFDRHKGYPTISHREAILKYGPCEFHRKSFRLLPVD